MVWRYIQLISPIGMMYALGDLPIAHAFFWFPRKVVHVDSPGISQFPCGAMPLWATRPWTLTFSWETAVQSILVKRIHFIDHDKNVDPNTVDGSEILEIHHLGCQNLINSHEPNKTTYQPTSTGAGQISEPSTGAIQHDPTVTVHTLAAPGICFITWRRLSPSASRALHVKALQMWFGHWPSFNFSSSLDSEKVAIFHLCSFKCLFSISIVFWM